MVAEKNNWKNAYNFKNIKIELQKEVYKNIKVLQAQISLFFCSLLHS